jgi:hypothetical protein
MRLLPLPCRRFLTAAAAEACSEGELPASAAEAGIPVAARLEAEPPGRLGDCPALPPGTVISGRACPSGQLALTEARTQTKIRAAMPVGPASPDVDGHTFAGHGSASISISLPAWSSGERSVRVGSFGFAAVPRHQRGCVRTSSCRC